MKHCFAVSFSSLNRRLQDLVTNCVARRLLDHGYLDVVFTSQSLSLQKCFPKLLLLLQQLFVQKTVNDKAYHCTLLENVQNIWKRARITEEVMNFCTQNGQNRSKSVSKGKNTYIFRFIFISNNWSLIRGLWSGAKTTYLELEAKMGSKSLNLRQKSSLI